ncbi:MAG: lauroyl acyltransferase [Gammaproteobacteria bacterium]|nr:MAG: lauroyl acyltransferase [Gammaproteobacteria bacterium]
MNAFLNNMSHLLLASALSVLALLPLRWAQAIGSGIGCLIYRLGRKRVHIARCNLQVCYPSLSDAEREAWVEQSFREAGKWFAEFGLAWVWPASWVNRKIRVHNQHLFDEALAQGRGVVLILPHLGNWELLNSWVSNRAPFAALYKPLESDWFERFVMWRRSRQDTVMAPVSSGGVRTIMKCLKQGYVTAVLSDHLPSTKAGVFAPFFGRPALTGKLTGALARANHSVVLSATVVRKPKGEGFELVFQPVDGLHDADEHKAAEALNRAIEQCIALAPQQYQWMYKRFSKRPEGVADIYR